jgi:hypothetical protein
MNRLLQPRRVLCGLVVQQARLLAGSIVLLLLSPRAKTTEHLAGFFLLATDRVTRVTLLGLHGLPSQETPSTGHTPCFVDQR